MDTNRSSLRVWVVEALRDLGGKAWLIAVADHIWTNHEDDIRRSRKLLLTWQYDMRWAATSLRKQGYLKFNEKNEPWELTDKGTNGELPWT